MASAFSTSQNPIGAWTYGWVSSIGGSLSLYNTVDNASSGVPEWRSDHAIVHGMVCKNISGAIVPSNYASQYWEIGMAGLHPGETGDLATARWTAPSAALVTIYAQFTGQSFNSVTTTDVHVVKNGVSLFDAVVNGFAGTAAQGHSDASGVSPVQEFTSTVAVSAGDRIDFCVGYGNGSYVCDITGLAATVTTRTDMGLIQGIVSLGVDGNPSLKGAVVRTSDGSASTVTGTDGSYSLLVSSGTITLEAVLAGLKTVQTQVSAPGGGTAICDFRLYPDYGSTYYVSTYGNDDADGRTPTTAWRTISNGDAKGLLVAGDTVLVAQGIYPQTDYLGVQLVNCSGQSGNPITYKAFGRVLIDQTGISKPTACSYGFRVMASNVHVQGFEIVGCQWGIYIGPDSHGNVICDCIIHDAIPGDANATDSHAWCGGVFISSASDNLIHHSQVYDIGSQGGRTAGCVMSTGSAQSNRIYNNTFARSWSGVHAWSNAGVTGAQDVRNNIIVEMWDHGIDDGESTGCIHSHDLFYQNAANYGGASAGSGDIQDDPRFMVGSFALQSISPAVDAAEDVGFPCLDFDPDIGALEHVPEIAGEIGYLKSLPDGTAIDLAEKVATADSLTFSDNSFYVEEPDRAAGIRIAPGAAIFPILAGDRLSFRGTMGTDASGERFINLTSAAEQTAGEELGPVGMTSKAISARAGLNPCGLLVRTCGWVTHVAGDGSFVYIDDGCGSSDGSGYVGVRVELGGHILPLIVTPREDQFIAVTGVLGAFIQDGASGPVIRPREDSDISILIATVSETNLRRQWVRDNLENTSAVGPFFFTYNGQASSALLSGWNRTYETEPLDSVRTQRTTSYTDPTTGLQVRCVSVEYLDYPTVEWTVYLKNTGSSDTPVIENLQGLYAALAVGSQGDTVLHYNTGSLAGASDYQPFEETLVPGVAKVLAVNAGRGSEAYLPFFNLSSDDGGIILAVGWPGQWAARFVRGEATQVAITAGQELTHFTLQPGEEVRTPLMVLQFYNGDQVRSQNVWRRWMLAHNVPKPGGQLPAPRLSAMSWFAYNGIGSTEGELYFMNRYLAAGIKPDVWWIDAGWYPCSGSWVNTGNWEVDLTRYPNGLSEIFSKAHANGMRTMVWFEPERVVWGTWLAQNHPEWVLGLSGSSWGVLNLGNADAWSWLTSRVGNLMTSQGIDDYRQDFNIAPIGHWRGNDTADRQGITEIKHIMGYLAFWDDIRSRHPGALIDSCASGGRRNDLETLRRAVPLWRSDYTFEPTGTQCHTYGISSWMPYNGTGVQSTDAYTFRSNMTLSTASCLDMRNTQISMTQLSNLVSQWRSVAPNYFGDYYPLTPYSLAADSWMAWQFDRPEDGQGMVQVFRRPGCPSSSIVLKLFGLDANASYTLTDIDTGTTHVLSGQYLMDQGLSVIIQSSPGSSIITYCRNH